MKFIFILLLIIPFGIYAQFQDDFSDGNFTNNPEWAGETAKFRVEAEELQLYDTINYDSDTAPPPEPAWLTTQSEAINDASWEFLARFEFNPSGSNYADVYLVSNTQNINGEASAYFVKLGNTDDEVSLYRKDGNTTTKIIDGTDKRLDSNLVNVRVKVTRDHSGNWALYSDTLGSFNYFLEGNAFDNTYISSAYFGVNCIYSKTRKQHMYFDDIVVTGNPFVDDIAPEITSYEIIDDQNIEIVFNEDMESTTTLNSNNYIVNNGIGSPVSINFVSSSTQSIILEFDQSFDIGTDYILQYQNMEDLAGNPIESGSLSFAYYENFENMFVINEIMADPTPVVGLPDAEFIEIYNRQNYSLNLNNLTLKVGTYNRTIPNFQLNANDYAIICHENDVSLFEEYGTVIGIPSFPALTNSGTTISIYDENELEIDLVSYTDSWYQDSQKADGGWTLERIDPENTCGALSNWIASVDMSGGTPGQLNSVYAENTDTEPPQVVAVQINGNNSLKITYNEYTNPTSSLNIEHYIVSNDYGNPVYITPDEDNPMAVILYFAVSFQHNTPYILTVEYISDLCDNTLFREDFEFMLYRAMQFDVLITEIMADQEPVVQLPNAEYIELYNNTELPIDLTEWKLNVSSYSRTLPYYVIEPNSYICLVHIDNISMFSEFENVLGVESMPILSNSGTTISIQNKEGDYIHSINYNDQWYNSSFKKEGGWSLEMIDLNNPCTGAENWTASEDLKGGTPAEQNSVFNTNPDNFAPRALGAEIVNADTVRVFFDEPLLLESMNHTSNYLMDHDIGNPLWVYPEPPAFESVLLKFDFEFVQGEVYYIEIADTLRDCVGNYIESNSIVAIAVPDSICEGDLLINEVLFNPYPNSYDFVEVFNNSNKVFDLKKIWIANRNNDNEIDNVKPIREKSFLVLPYSYCAISEDISDIASNYNTPYPNNLCTADHLPSMPDSEGKVILLDRYMNIIDEMHYNEKMHFALLSDDEGVSLERINFSVSALDETNWFSAAESIGFATPGYQNSQFREIAEIDDEINLESEVFSPDSDGIDDRLIINYAFEEAGSVANIAVYNTNGRFITWIAQNTSLAAEGVLYWDGLDNKNLRCPIGIYIIYAEIYSPFGTSKVYKIPCVLSIKNF
ncbi:MAG: lamin tail domain-containing protein [Bacteroidales bacterium]|nr:lamin tail domain-containing protein [Bacteroidales bacterium]